jgi:hypothetical protein
LSYILILVPINICSAADTQIASAGAEEEGDSFEVVISDGGDVSIPFDIS